MAGSNPKIAALFGGNNFGADLGAVNNAAMQDQSALKQAATAADARAFMSDREAENIVEMGKLNAAGIKSQASAGSTGMAGQALGAVGQVAGLFGGGGFGGGGGANMGGGGYYDSMTGLGTAGPNFGL